jgi:hypothetical protein
VKPHYSVRRVYIATPWFGKAAAEELARLLVERGHDITCCWWNWGVSDEKTITHDARCGYACALDDSIAACDVFIHLPVDREQRGGNYVDLGMAIGMGKPILSLGWSVLSHAHPLVHVVETLPDLLGVLRGEIVVRPVRLGISRFAVRLQTWVFPPHGD